MFGVVGGVVVAIALSIGVFLYRSARPHDAVLGRVDDVDGYQDIARWEGAETLPGLLVYRFDAPPFFVNAEYLRQRVLELVDASEDVRWFVLNAEAWTYLDATAIDVLIQLHDELEERGIALCFARLKGRQREIFEETGLTARIGPDRFFPTVRAAVAAFESAHAGDADRRSRDALAGVDARSFTRVKHARGRCRHCAGRVTVESTTGKERSV